MSASSRGCVLTASAYSRRPNPHRQNRQCAQASQYLADGWLLTCLTLSGVHASPELPNKEASTFRSLAVLFWLGFISAARNLGGRPYRRMLSTKSLIAQMWIHALNACTRAKVLTVVDQSSPRACWSLPVPQPDIHVRRPGPTHLVERVKSRYHDQPVHTSVQGSEMTASYLAIC